MTDVNLRILLSASQGNTMSVISTVTKALGSGGAGAAGVGLVGALAAVGVAAAGVAIAIGVKSVQSAADFQNAMLQNVAHAGLAKNQFDAVSKSVLQMSTDVGQMPTDLAQALYPILSGFSGINNQAAKAQTSLEALRLSAEDVTGTTTKTTTASSALVATFNALGLQTNSTAANIAHLRTLNDQMEATIIAGNMHWQDYANVAGKLATAIKGTNVQWTEASAALATMTNEGFTAQRSQTYLANLFTQLDLKTDSLNKNAKKLNIAFDEQKFKSMSLSDQLNYLQKITGGNSSEVLKLLNNNATALKTYNALESGMKSYKTNLDAIKNSHGATANAFQTASSSFQAAGGRMRAALEVVFITIGNKLLPVLTNLVNRVTPVISAFAQWITHSGILDRVMNALGSFFQSVLVPIFNTYQTVILTRIVPAFQQMWTAIQPIMPQLKQLAVVVGVIVFGALLLFIHIWGAVWQAVAGGIQVLAGLIAFFVDLFTGKWTNLGNDLKIIGGGLLTILKAPFLALWDFITGFFPKLGDYIGSFFSNFGSLVHSSLANAPVLGGALHDLHIPGFASGVTNFSGGLAYVHQGEVLSNLAPGTNVTPASRVSLGGGPNITINVSTIAGSRAEINRMVDLLEREIAARFRGQTSYGFGGVV